MIKSLFTIEREINATPKTLFPFITSPSLLKKWFADDVLVEHEESDEIQFLWDGVAHKARITGRKDNLFIRYEFMDADEGEEPSWLQFRVEVNQLTNATYLIIEDFSEIDNPADYEEMYNHNLSTLTEIVGGSTS